MSEWWQEGAEDVAVPVPRRDQVPQAGFSDPRSVTVNPEAVVFIPEWRRGRRLIAIGVTLASVGVAAWAVIDLVNWTRTTDLDARALGAILFTTMAIRVAVAGFATWRTWVWAEQPDPRNLRRGSGGPPPFPIDTLKP